MGGRSNGDELRLSSVERFDPRTGRWELMPPMRKQRAFFGAAVISGKVFVCGGSRRGEDYSVVQVYHEETDTWEYGAQLKGNKSGAAAVVVSLT
ncbi:kelch repeat protein, partial [Ancylostoma duodenale]